MCRKAAKHVRRSQAPEHAVTCCRMPLKYEDTFKALRRYLRWPTKTLSQGIEGNFRKNEVVTLSCPL